MNRYVTLLTLLAFLNMKNMIFSREVTPDQVDEAKSSQEGKQVNLMNIILSQSELLSTWPNRAEISQAVDKGWLKGEVFAQELRDKLDYDDDLLATARDDAFQRFQEAINNNPQCLRESTQLTAKNRRKKALECAQILGIKGALLAHATGKMPAFMQSAYHFEAKAIAVLHSAGVKP